MANKSTTGPLPGPVRQIGYVVRDLEAALAQWGALGIQQHGDTPSIFTEFLDSGREGLHQLAWCGTAATLGRRGSPTSNRLPVARRPSTS